MASVKANKDKSGKVISYRFRCCVGRDEAGRQQFVTKTVPAPEGLTPAKAMKQMQTEADVWERKVRQGNAPQKYLSFKVFIEDHFLPIHCAKLSSSTVGFYSDICAHLVERFGSKQLDKIHSIDIERFLMEAQTEKHVDRHGVLKTWSSAYVKHHRTVLTVAFNFAERHGLVERNPMRMVGPVASERHTIDFLSENEVEHFLTCLDDEEIYWKAAINVLIFCGLRRGELAGLQWCDFDAVEQTLTVCRNVVNNKQTGRQSVVKSTKTSTSDRVLPVSPRIHGLLMAWRAEQERRFGCLLPHAFIFGGAADCYSPLRPDSIAQWLSRFEKRHGLRKVSPHDLRHTCGTLLLASGASVKEVQTLLGHADASTTLKFYVGVDTKRLRGAADRLETFIAAGE